MDDNPLRRNGASPKAAKPKIWAEGSQRPPFVPRAFALASLHYAREGVGPLFGILARATARLAATIATGDHRLPADRLGRAEALVPSYTRVASWIMATADILARSGFIAHSDPALAARLRASVPPLDWSLYLPQTASPAAPDPIPAPPAPEQPAPGPSASVTPPETVAPVTLQEPAPPADDDPLAAIRADLAGAPLSEGKHPPGKQHDKRPRPAPQPPKAPGPRGALADGLIDAAGFALGWAASLVALPWGVIRASYGHLKGEDLRKVATPD